VALATASTEKIPAARFVLRPRIMTLPFDDELRTILVIP
jgi:hypothetical protein